MAIFRYIDKYLKKWKVDPERKPLVLRGARQVGKTTSINKFSKFFKYAILLNLEKPKDQSYFKDHDYVKTILESLFLSYNLSMSNISETLLFIDEIQESPKAIQLLRYFYEEFPKLPVIAAGSLLEFAMRHVKSFPVGRIEYLYMHPLNFPEYLNAIGHTSALEQLDKVADN